MTTAGKSNNCHLWGECLNYISLRIKSSTFSTWFKHTGGAMDEKGQLRIIVQNDFVGHWMSDKYSELISEAIREVNGSPMKYYFEIEEKEEAAQTEFEFHHVPAPVRPMPNDCILNERYRFDTFVVGDFNQFPHAAAIAVAESPGKTNYNPLFIYGGTGLGKTHLVQATGHYIRDKYPNKKVILVSSEKFTRDFIDSLSNGTIASFTSQYRTADVLLIDDIQFFSGKESTQEQFFHTFNELYQLGKQIILTSDRHPKDTKGLEERLLSRFSSGLVADLQPPNLEARVAILRKRTVAEDVSIPDDVLYFIANNVTTNIRELEGCFNRLLAYSSLEKGPITVEFAMRILGKELAYGKKDVTIDLIKRKTAEFFKIEPAMLIAKKKTSEIALARQVAMFLSRKFTRSSLKAIGDAFGGRDHTTVIHACNLIEGRIKMDLSFGEKVNKLTAIIMG
ncbi:chromosomal replication initiator protein DnaA, DNA-binding transcriptional dual regulator [Candidatus Zixiibacteriota bacterium]|nr:chromosomal replication initiator protein DnaA, DNA-binding transcriptional dual regulator [candidate division Zixibacteria bacterium]